MRIEDARLTSMSQRFPSGVRVVSIIGVPGTGKSEVSKALCRLLRAVHIDVSSYAIASGLAVGFDGLRDTYIVDVEGLRRRLNALVGDSNEVLVIEGHYLVLDPHFLDAVFILRTHPEVLYKRLRMSRRHWSIRKVLENVTAEFVGSCLTEVLGVCRGGRVRCCEIDTTGRRPGEVALDILDYLSGRACKEPPSIDWLDASVSSELLNELTKFL